MSHISRYTSVWGIRPLKTLKKNQFFLPPHFMGVTPCLMKGKNRNVTFRNSQCTEKSTAIVLSYTFVDQNICLVDEFLSTSLH